MSWQGNEADSVRVSSNEVASDSRDDQAKQEHEGGGNCRMRREERCMCQELKAFKARCWL